MVTTLTTYILAPFRLLLLPIYRFYVYLMLPVYKRLVERLYAQADVKLNGDRPWDLKIKNDQFYLRIAHQALGFDLRGYGETYMDGDFECERLDLVAEKVMKSGI